MISAIKNQETLLTDIESFCLLGVHVDFTLQINELSKRMLAIESLLSRLEEKITPGVNEVRCDDDVG